jgi:hypothetical protein
VCSWNESRDVEKLDRNRPPTIDAAAIVRFTSVGEVVFFARTVDLEVADGALRVYCCEANRDSVDDVGLCSEVVSYGKLPGKVL